MGVLLGPRFDEGGGERGCAGGCAGGGCVGE